MKPTQLELMTTVSAPSLAPDGRHAVVATSRASFAADAYVGQLWLLDLHAGARPRRITRGSGDGQPRYSPDGRTIAFLRRDERGRPQLAAVDARGGEPRVLTDRLLGVGGFTWSRDSRRIAFTSRTPAEGRYGSLDGVGPGAEDPRRTSGLKYRANGLGYTEDKRQGVFVLEVPPTDEEPWIEPVGRAAETDADAETSSPYPEAVLATPANRDASDPEFSPDGTLLYFTAALHDGADRDLRSNVYRVPVPQPGGAAGEPELVAGGARSGFAYGTPVFSRDGSTLYLLGQELGPDGTDFVARNTGVFALGADDVGRREAAAVQPRLLTDLDASDYGDAQAALVPHAGGGVLAFARHRGSGELHLIEAHGSIETLVAGPLEVTGAAEAAGTVVVSYAAPSSPGEVGLVASGGVRPLTDFAASLRHSTRIAEPRELTVASGDGYPVHGWVYLPEGEGPHPVLLNIHGGPFSQYGWAYFDEVQAYTQAGYAVVQCNPRGSAGYGRAHGLAIKEAMGTVDLQDVLAFLDGALAEVDALDGSRTGVLGGSYGGYLTAWTIAHDHRFAAAVVERGYLDPVSFVGSSDIGWFFSDAYTGTDAERIQAQSPMAVAGQVKTPTLVVHSEEDYRCPVEQAQRYYVQLLRHGVEAELLLFPGENHELSRSGTPWHRRQRFEAILEWFGRYLPVERAG